MTALPTRVLVVGGSKGAGRRVVEELTARGSRCAIGYAKDDDAAHTAYEASALHGHAPVLAKGDIADEAPSVVRQAVDGLGGLDGLVITAVPVITGRALSLTRESFDRINGVLAWGLLDTVREAAPHIQAAGGGAVVVVTSIGARLYASYYGTLGPAKAAAEAYVRTLAAELGPRQVRVNAIAPCLIDDEAHTNYASRAREFLEPVARRTPLRRLATPEDIANATLALLGSDLGFVTGQVLDVDGGYGLMG